MAGFVFHALYTFRGYYNTNFEGSESMKYYIADYRTYDGDHEYVEYSVMSDRTYETAERRAINGRKLFTRYDGGISPV